MPALVGVRLEDPESWKTATPGAKRYHMTGPIREPVQEPGDTLSSHLWTHT